VGVVFELALSFSHEMPAVGEAVDAAKATVLATGDIHLGDLPVRLLGPRIAGLSWDRHVELTVGLQGVGYPSTPHPELQAADLSDAEISELGWQLYDLLRRIGSFQLAMVGWDVEEAVDPELLRIRLGEFGLRHLEGLVVADHLAESLGLSADLAPFEPGYCWLPYEGSENPFSPRRLTG